MVPQFHRYAVDASFRFFRIPKGRATKLSALKDAPDALEYSYTDYCEVELLEPLNWHRCQEHDVIVERRQAR